MKNNMEMKIEKENLERWIEMFEKKEREIFKKEEEIILVDRERRIEESFEMEIEKN